MWYSGNQPITGGETSSMFKSHGCGDLRLAHVGTDVKLAGWVHLRRDFGGVIFIVLRDRAGVVQVVVSADVSADARAAAAEVRSEYVIQVEGTVRRRPDDQVNPEWLTGEIEVEARSVQILNTSKTPPFYIYDDGAVDEALRLRSSSDTWTCGARVCSATSSCATARSSSSGSS